MANIGIEECEKIVQKIMLASPTLEGVCLNLKKKYLQEAFLVIVFNIISRHLLKWPSFECQQQLQNNLSLVNRQNKEIENIFG